MWMYRIRHLLSYLYNLASCKLHGNCLCYGVFYNCIGFGSNLVLGEGVNIAGLCHEKTW